MKKKKYESPDIEVYFAYDLDTELMYGNDLGGGTFGGGPGFSIGSPSSTPPVDPIPDDFIDDEDSDR